MIAALFVATGGPYFGLLDVDPWDEARDARLYEGPHPVVAHPPCERWGRYATGGPNPNAKRRQIGDDEGCFASAIEAVRRYGGVLEHPEASHAWAAFGLKSPPKVGLWHRADTNGYTCCVEQGHYGHPARKATWLYAVGQRELPTLIWGPSQGTRLEEGFHSKEEATAERARRKALGIPAIKRLSRDQRVHTPIEFRDVLIRLARDVE